ncbi:zinc finger CCCH domain-containing protein 59 [Typha latifolia]|uniref:zinc finger CCCH domain-containing protein 59 n=1 Tax=Typha latifolia TaxID=4733 RepID=UPI003C2E08B1
MASPPPRILLCGDVVGRLRQLFKRVNAVNQSTGPFDALLCVGQFFPDTSDRVDELSEYLEGRTAVPIPTYFTGDYGIGAPRFLSPAAKIAASRGFKTDGIEVCPNLYWLKGSGKFALKGLSVVYLSGKSSSGLDGSGGYNVDDVDALRALAEEPGIVDLFLSNEWPLGLANGANTSEAPTEVMDPSGCSPIIAELAAEIKPRYHIAGTKGIFYAREPYSNSEAAHVTRFIGLAIVGNKDKQRFIHALSPTPASTMSTSEICTRPPNTTLSPYKDLAKMAHVGEATKRSATSDDTQYWRYDVSQKRQRQGGADGQKLCFNFTSSGSCSRGDKCHFRHDADAREHYLKNVCFDFLNKGKCERGSDCKFVHSLSEDGASLSRDSRSQSDQRRSGRNCWFCLSSPNVESHLILSIGESYYCALAKGPLVQNHVLLLPIEHCPNTLMMSSESEAELGMYKQALSTYFKNQSKAVVYFEWVFQHNPHANLQVIPIPSSKASSVQKIFNLAAKRLGFEFSVLNTDEDSTQGRKLLRSQYNGKSNLFYVEVPEGKILLHTVDDNEKFPVQFGREVLAGLSNMPDRADWRNCKVSKEEEVQMVEAFKQGFGEFDPAR